MNVNGFYANYVELINERSPESNMHVDRKSFMCMHVAVVPNSDFGKRVKDIADNIKSRLNTGQAYSSESRDENVVEVDNLSGVLAEIVCFELLKYRYGNAISKTESTSAVDQIDITVNESKTIEVRSSCIRNGITFSIFSTRKDNKDDQNINLLGPYSNGYKPGEKPKDYYLGVIFPFGIDDFMGKWNKNELIHLFVTGGATNEMMRDKNIYQIKHLKPNRDLFIKVESQYRVIPFAKSLDIREFFSVFELENNDIKIRRSFLKETNNICWSCYSEIENSVHSYSLRTMGIPLCHECQRKNKNTNAIPQISKQEDE